MVVDGRMPLRKLPYYWLAQVLGAFAAGMLVYGIFSGSIASFELVHNITRGTGASVKTAMMFGEYFPEPRRTRRFSFRFFFPLPFWSRLLELLCWSLRSLC